MGKEGVAFLVLVVVILATVALVAWAGVTMMKSQCESFSRISLATGNHFPIRWNGGECQVYMGTIPTGPVWIRLVDFPE